MYDKIGCKSERKNVKHIKRLRTGELARHSFLNKCGRGIHTHHCVSNGESFTKGRAVQGSIF